MASECRATCKFENRCTMATPILKSNIESLISEYGVFWQLWPQFEQTHGERYLAGFELELIGSHNSDLNHVDPACPGCRDVRTTLLAIAHLLTQELSSSKNSFTCNIDSHSDSILCLPALGNRSAVSVSICVFWSRSDGHSVEADLLAQFKTSLNKWGIHQR